MGHKEHYKKVSNDVRERLAEVNEDMNLFNAGFEQILAYTGSFQKTEGDRAEADWFLKTSYY